MVDVIDPAGLVRSQVIENDDGALRLTLNGAENRQTLAGHFIAESFGSGVQHLAFATADIFATAAALARARLQRAGDLAELLRRPRGPLRPRPGPRRPAARRKHPLRPRRRRRIFPALQPDLRRRLLLRDAWPSSASMRWRFRRTTTTISKRASGSNRNSRTGCVTEMSSSIGMRAATISSFTARPTGKGSSSRSSSVAAIEATGRPMRRSASLPRSERCGQKACRGSDLHDATERRSVRLGQTRSFANGSHSSFPQDLPVRVVQVSL